MRDEPNDFFTFTETQTRTYCEDRTEQSFPCLSLNKYVSQVISDLSPRVPEQPLSIINDVHADMYVSTDKEALVTILTRLVRVIVADSQNNRIHISAKSIGNIALVHMRGSHAAYNHEMALSLEKIEPLAERLGGCVTISNIGMYGISLAFTFINH